uniref:Uncharacterized protein n=1 Tax=Leersia perrieri TaxID=77586 RepID=A0A0D9VR60_9ORYZ
MEAATPTPTRPSHAAPASPSPASLRQWRPAAQRNLRNQWSRLLAAKARYIPGMDLGVLKDMPGIRDKASDKLARREEQCQSMLLSAYKEMVLATAELVKASQSMRCFSKIATNSPLIRFTERQDDMNDSGDGGGAPVFKWSSILEFENIAQELVEMFISELQLKVYLTSWLANVNIKTSRIDEIFELVGDEMQIKLS